MAHKPKRSNSHSGSSKPTVAIDPSLPSFEGHPFFEKKAADAKNLLKKVGLPKSLPKRSKA